jgi:phage terminase large subunit GpA-like protein
LVTARNRRGYSVREWQKMRERNEALDCYVYARAAAAVVGLDRFEERHWRQLERQLGASKGSEAERESADRSFPKRDAPKTRSPGISRKSEPWLGGRQRHWLRRD